MKKVGALLPAFLFYTTLCGQQYALKNFSVTDGLPQSQVFGLYQDPDGYIWMGTKGGGIVKFDGHKFEPVTNDKDLAFIHKLVPYGKKVYIGHATGYAVYDITTKSVSHPYNTVNANHEAVSAILPLGKDSLLVATTRYIYLGRNGKLTRVNYTVRDNDDVPNCAIQHNGHIYLGNNYGLVKLNLENNPYTVSVMGRKYGLKTTAVRCLVQYNNQLLVGIYGGGIYQYANGKFERYAIPGIGSSEVIQCFLTDKKNNLWIGTGGNGVFAYDVSTRKTSHFTEAQGLCRNNIVSMLEDDWGNIWLGSSGGGVSRYNGQLFVHYTNRSGLPGKNVYACVQTPDSVIWLGTSAPGVTTIANGEIHQLDAGNGFTDAKIKNIHYSAYYEMLLLATEGDGIWTYANGIFDKPESLNRHTGKWIKHITEDENHRLVVSTASKGVICFNAALEYEFTLDKTNHLPVNRINQSLVNGAKIWMATEGGGLVCFDETKHLETMPATGNIVRSVIADADGRVWIGTPSGLGYFTGNNPDNFKAINLPQGYNNVYLLYSRGQNLYAGTAKGIVKLNFEKGITQLQTTLFSANEGFTGIECSQNAVGAGIGNTVLFGTINGLSIFQPEFEQFNHRPPKLNFEQVNLFYENLLDANRNLENPIFNYQQNHLGFKFMAINQLDPDGVNYQWKLDGLEQNWSPVTLTNEVNYTNLEPGAYTFMVRAGNENGTWTKQPLRFAFTITRPWFRQPWFYVAITLLVVTVIALTYMLLTRSSRKKRERERNRLVLENKLLEIQQMALRLQMNPHFIFNCLNSIQNLVSQNRNEDSNFYIQKFSALMRGMVDLTPKETIRLDQEIKLLTSYLELEQLNRSNSFTYDIHLQLEDDTDFYRIPPLLLQPFAENAIVHGFKGIEYTGHIQVDVTEENNNLVIHISDNGRGYGDNLALPEDRNSALKITQQRLDLYNGIKGNWLTLRHHTPTGTVIKIVLKSN